jgi:dGTPase
LDGGFRHNEQSLRVVDRIEKDGRGLNLTYEVRNGILNHTDACRPETLEGQVVRLSDRIAYINHDVDDALRAGILDKTDIPDEINCAFGDSPSARIDTIIKDIVRSSTGSHITMSPGVSFVFEGFYSFMYGSVYTNMRAKSEEKKVFGIIAGIFDNYTKNPDALPEDYARIAETDGLRRAVADYVSGMTDKYAVYQFSGIFMPEAWQVR